MILSVPWNNFFNPIPSPPVQTHALHACISSQARTKWEPFESLSLNLPFSPHELISKGVHVEDLLRVYTAPELVHQVKCDHCSNAQGREIVTTFVKRTSIAKVGRVSKIKPNLKY